MQLFVDIIGDGPESRAIVRIGPAEPREFTAAEIRDGSVQTFLADVQGLGCLPDQDDGSLTLCSEDDRVTLISGEDAFLSLLLMISDGSEMISLLFNPMAAATVTVAAKANQDGTP